MKKDTPTDHDITLSYNYKDVLFNNKTAIDYLQYYNNSPDTHKATIALHLFGFGKTKIASVLSIDRTTVYRILDVFKELPKDESKDEIEELIQNKPY